MVMVVWGLKNTRLATTHTRATRNGHALIAVPLLSSSTEEKEEEEEEVNAVAVKPATARHSRLNLKYASNSFACARPKLSLTFVVVVDVDVWCCRSC